MTMTDDLKYLHAKVDLLLSALSVAEVALSLRNVGPACEREERLMKAYACVKATGQTCVTGDKIVFGTTRQ